MIKISVVIPAYNAQDTIISCIESVLNQNSDTIHEIIIVNDGSTDDTEKVVIEYKQGLSIEKLRIFTQANAGPSKARNFGIKQSSGNWIAFLDSDDRWHPDKISEQVDCVLKNPEYVLVGTTLIKKKNEKNNSIKQISFNMMLFKNWVFTSSVLVRKDILMRFFFDENKKYGEDFKLWLQISYSNKLVVLNNGLVYYTENMTDPKGRNISCNLYEMEKNEIENFKFLYNEKMINVFMMIMAVGFSYLKYFKRKFIRAIK